jgi:hypothetical protein
MKWMIPAAIALAALGVQGSVGTGSRCAAQIGDEASGKKAPSEISVEYTIEPTTDGKTMVGARFRSNF